MYVALSIVEAELHLHYNAGEAEVLKVFPVFKKDVKTVKDKKGHCM